METITTSDEDEMGVPGRPLTSALIGHAMRQSKASAVRFLSCSHAPFPHSTHTPVRPH